MSKFRDIKINVVTDAGGDFSEETAVGFGRLVAVEVNDIDLAATADITIACTSSPGGIDRDLIVLTNVTADAWHDVRGLGSNVAGASSSEYVHPFVAGAITVTVAQGGNVLTGTVVLYIEE